ncbi:MAG: Crp/Fnr family transcriptional regulator [Anaerolineales bacterium]|nr:Crp/Fnr family transcriptional regulator [Anaerolineales bacterium]
MLTMTELHNADTRSLLDKIQLLEGLTPPELAWVAARAHRRIFPANTSILTAEQPGEAVYVILHGTVKIHIEQVDGRDVVISILGSGDVLGEMSLIDSVGRSASAVTLDDTLMLWMDKSTFQTLLDEYPPVARNLVRILSARVRLADELIQALATLDVNGRVARQLLAFAEKYGRTNEAGVIRIPITLTQGDIADLVGASRKRVNQIMVAFKSQHLVTTAPDGRLVIRDPDGLARICR